MIYKFKVQWGRLLAVAIATLFISLGLPNWKIFQTQALNVPENNLIAQNVSAVWNKGSFPVENFQSYTSGFGYRISPVTGERQFHNGLDLAAPRGSYIRNWWSGKVVEVSDDTACGTMISIQSGAWEHFYCHMEGYVQGSSLIDREGGLQIALGQNIPAGARIGRIGMSGRTTGPHLHWGLKHNGGYIDPVLVLKEMFKRQTISSTS